jgi:predicted oxidoreductase
MTDPSGAAQVSSISLCDRGPTFSRLVAGLWRLSEWGYTPRERLRFVQDCIALGVTTFDEADIYGDYESERLFGEALALSPGIRSQIQIVTKSDIKLVSEKYPSHSIGQYDTSAGYLTSSLERSLTSMGTDHVDLLLVHRPDPLMDPDEVARAFMALHDAGKVLHFGVSNFSPSQFELLQARLPLPLVTNQVECSVLEFEAMHDGTLDQCLRLRRAPMAWSTLGGGRLFQSQDSQASRVRTALDKIGKELGGATLDQVALAWLMRHPARIIPVLGTGKAVRVKAAVEAESLSISRQQWFEIWRASRGHDVP